MNMDLPNSVLASLCDSVQVFDRAGTCMYANRAAAMGIGLASDTLVGRSWRDLGPLAESAQAMETACESVFASGEPHRGETVVATAGGVRVYEYSLSPLLEGSDRVKAVIYLARDVTARKRLEDADRQSLQESILLNDRLRRVVYGANHRIKNHLQLLAAIADLQLLQGEERIPASEFRRWVGHLRTIAAVHDLLVSETSMEPAADHVPVRSLLEQVVELYENVLGPGRVHVDIEEAVLLVPAATALAALVNELVANAVKHGGKTIEVMFQVREGAGQLAVTDDGPGLPEDFDPASPGQTGLDLIEGLTRWDLGGKTHYENRAEGGTRVTVTIPLEGDRR